MVAGKPIYLMRGNSCFFLLFTLSYSHYGTLLLLVSYNVMIDRVITITTDALRPRWQIGFHPSYSHNVFLFFCLLISSVNCHAKSKTRDFWVDYLDWTA
jgi:hypothetical protein